MPARGLQEAASEPAGYPTFTKEMKHEVWSSVRAHSRLSWPAELECWLRFPDRRCLSVECQRQRDDPVAPSGDQLSRADSQLDEEPLRQLDHSAGPRDAAKASRRQQRARAEPGHIVDADRSGHLRLPPAPGRQVLGRQRDDRGRRGLFIQLLAVSGLGSGLSGCRRKEHHHDRAVYRPCHL